MLSWALFFFLIALVAALFGFGGVAGTTASIAHDLDKILPKGDVFKLKIQNVPDFIYLKQGQKEVLKEVHSKRHIRQ